MSSTLVSLDQASTAEDPLRAGDASLESLQEAFRDDGFVLFHHALRPSLVSALQRRLEEVLLGRFDRGAPPDKAPKPRAPPKAGKRAAATAPRPLGYDGNRNNSRVLQIINIHKCDREFRALATSPEIGRMVAELAGWEHGSRLAQDQVWAKPPGAPPLVFHRDSPYFMFTPSDVVTVWVALDHMDAELGPLEYVRGSHRWGDGRVGSSSSFFQAENRNLLYSAARLEGIPDPADALDIVPTAGLRAGGLSIHHGKVWHGSGRNRSADRPRRGVGLHYVPAEARFTAKARRSQLWRRYLPDEAECDEDLANTELSGEQFPLVWKRPR